MQALQAKQIEAQKYRDIIENKDGSILAKSIDERVQYNKNLQYVDHKKLFAVMYSTIHKAAQDNSLEGMRFFLAQKKPKVHIDEFDKSGSCPIHIAAERGHVDSVNFCVDKGCNFNITTTYGTTAMMLACKENHLRVIELLFGMGASLSAKNKAGNTAIHFATQGDHADAIRAIVELTLQRQEAEEAAAKAAAAAELGEDDDVEKLPDTFTDGEESVLDNGHSNILDGFGSKSLLEQSGNNPELGNSMLLNDVNLGKITPLMMAAQHNSIKVIELLIQLGVPLDRQDASGETALHKAGRRGCFPVYRALLGAGASETVRNKFNETPRDLKVDAIDY